MDPVGQYGKGPRYVYKHLLLAGCTDVCEKSYEGARHELFNETCRDDAFADIKAFAEALIK
jgi:alpha-beta hydrolase superfamily lysophospholipase